VKSDPLHPSGRRGIPSEHSSVKKHPSGLRDLSVRTPIYIQKLRTVPGCIRSDISATRPDAFQCSTSKMISFPNTDMGRQLQPSGHYPWLGKKCRRVAIVRPSVYTVPTSSPYYGNCMLQKCNHLDARATSSGRGSIQERISANLESRLHSCPSWHPQLPFRRLEKIVSDLI
jgi:hypothetical protein